MSTQPLKNEFEQQKANQLQHLIQPDQINKYERNLILAGRFSSLIGVILMLVLFDAIYNSTEHNGNIYSGYPGYSQAISGSINTKIKSVDHLSIEVSNPGIDVRFENAESSVWHHFWNGTLSISDEVRPGDYDLKVIISQAGSDTKSTDFVIRVYRDISEFNTQQKSYIRKNLHISPWWVFLGLLIIFCLSFVPVYLISGKKELLLKLMGRATIAKLKKSDGQYSIYFNLGSIEGVKKGDTVSIFTREGEKIGTAITEIVSSNKAMAVTSENIKISPIDEIRIK